MGWYLERSASSTGSTGVWYTKVGDENDYDGAVQACIDLNVEIASILSPEEMEMTSNVVNGGYTWIGLNEIWKMKRTGRMIVIGIGLMGHRLSIRIGHLECLIITTVRKIVPCRIGMEMARVCGTTTLVPSHFQPSAK